MIGNKVDFKCCNFILAEKGAERPTPKVPHPVEVFEDRLVEDPGDQKLQRLEHRAATNHFAIDFQGEEFSGIIAGDARMENKVVAPYQPQGSVTVKETNLIFQFERTVEGG